MGEKIVCLKSGGNKNTNEHLGMQYILQEMGEKIICLKSSGNLGKQSRLWLNEDLLYVLENDMVRTMTKL